LFSVEPVKVVYDADPSSPQVYPQFAPRKMEAKVIDAFFICHSN
jgi:hypothetical protein